MVFQDVTYWRKQSLRDFDSIERFAQELALFWSSSGQLAFLQQAISSGQAVCCTTTVGVVHLLSISASIVINQQGADCCCCHCDDSPHFKTLLIVLHKQVLGIYFCTGTIIMDIHIYWFARQSSHKPMCKHCVQANIFSSEYTENI